MTRSIASIALLLATMMTMTMMMLMIVSVNGDIYLQYPRGSNDRLDEATRERTNAQRLFNSQNNGRGGYNVGSTYYYVGSNMYIDWTAQHSCGNPNNNCEYILQYTCDDLLRDGTTTTTIPDPSQDANPKYGRHESGASFLNCQYRTRNKGLFTANQNLQGNGATYTRQNNAGTTYGFECPEERDYYPYWHPTMWRDIAIFTNQPTRCAAYQAISQNVAPRYYCVPGSTVLSVAAQTGTQGWLPITQAGCENGTVTINNVQYPIGGTWTTQPAWGIPAPACVQNLWQRDNHNGNVMAGYFLSYNWTVPNLVHERCALRIRYNISTEDFCGFGAIDSVQNCPTTNGSVSVQTASAPFTRVNNPNPAVNPAYVDVWSQYGLTYSDVAASFTATSATDANLKNSREYVLKNNPQVNIFGSLLPNTNASATPPLLRLQLAINTAQFGRTFQDRSFRFAIRQPPSSLSGAVIHNIGVRGHRGNIVQVYPATEYDFAPKDLHVANGEYVHFQWTGSNTNPAGAGNGLEGTDRSTAAVLKYAPYYRPPTSSVSATPATSAISTTPPPITASAVPAYASWGTSFPANINSSVFLGLSTDDRIRLATTAYNLNEPNARMGGQMSEMDDGDTYFDLGPRQVTVNGIFYYTSTRNNDFSNRDQKAKIVVSDSSSTSITIGWNGGTVLAAGGATMSIVQGALTQAVVFSVVSSPPSTASTFSGDASSNYITVTPLDIPFESGQSFTLTIPYSGYQLQKLTVYRSDAINGSWSSLKDSTESGSSTTISSSRGGVFVVQSEPNIGVIVGIVIGTVGGAALLIGGLFFLYRKNGGSCRKSQSQPTKKKQPSDFPDNTTAAAGANKPS